MVQVLHERTFDHRRERHRFLRAEIDDIPQQPGP